MITLGRFDGSRRRMTGLSAAGCLVCGMALVAMPGTPWLSETLGAGVTTLSLLLLITGCGKTAATADRTSVSLLPHPEAADPGAAPEQHAAAEPLPLASPSPGTTRDFATAMGMFGGEIVEQVETSVQSVLTENHQMREMGGDGFGVGAGDGPVQGVHRSLDRRGIGNRAAPVVRHPACRIDRTDRRRGA